MGLWDWYALISIATSFGVLAHFGEISEAVMMALMMGVAWPATWYVVYDNNRPSM